MTKSSDITSLVKWAESNGAELSPDVQFKEISQNNIGAIYDGKTTPSEDTYPISIPFKLIITPRTAISEFGKYLKSTDNKNHANAILKFYLCHERNNADSFFRPYLSLLPSLASIDSPYTWSAQDKAYLKGTNLGNSLKENLGSLVEEWWEVINLLRDDIAKPEQHFVNMKFYYDFKFYTDEDLDEYLNKEEVENWTSFPNFLWASLILKSRSFPAYLIDESCNKNDAMLLPVVDLLNHNPEAKVNWDVSDGFFRFKSESIQPGKEIFNNYGLKGNEELLLAYGFCIEGNPRDSVALKIKMPEEKLKEIEASGIKLPTIDDYTNAVVAGETSEVKTEYSDGVLFFINADHIPESLIATFQYLVQNTWEQGITLRMQLAGLNHLRLALETKKNMLSLDVPQESTRHKYIKWYIESQSRIFSTAVKQIKKSEKEILGAEKSHLITLKNVYKKDGKFAQSLLFLGFPDYESILSSEFQDQCWILWLMRCYNRGEYAEDEYLPEWIHDLFVRLRKETDITAQEVLNYKPIYDGLFPGLPDQLPEIYGKGQWTLSEFIVAAKLLDLISFVRGKEQECILVDQDYK